ncbi:VTT domain-containing protein [Clostridium sp. CX1]|uniref:YqaA family protein n=1 Tax=Clostridium sp. CX1 TaxID=2978346 RepID=UPI0021BE2228|nr:VTT domain-containing protein [Clostridium sp. CX1]MCT8975376.1 VTT domain-containing protein [Clostridium sp. CX1]
MINFMVNYGVIGIIISALIEPIFMPIPMELIFIPIAVANTKNAFLYSLILVFFCAIGSCIGYILGKSIGSHILKKLISDQALNKIERKYNENAFLTILTSTFTPIPYEAYVLSSGIFKVNFVRFIAAAVLSRVIRYVPQGIIISLYGATLVNVIKHYTIIIGLIVAIVVLLVRYVFKKG